MESDKTANFLTALFYFAIANFQHFAQTTNPHHVEKLGNVIFQPAQALFVAHWVRQSQQGDFCGKFLLFQKQWPLWYPQENRCDQYRC